MVHRWCYTDTCGKTRGQRAKMAFQNHERALNGGDGGELAG